MKNCTECNYEFTFSDRLREAISFRPRLKCKKCNSVYKQQYTIYKVIYSSIIIFISLIVFDNIFLTNHILNYTLYILITVPILIIFDLLPHKFQKYEKL